MGYYYFIAFLSLLFHIYISLRWLYLISSLSVTLFSLPSSPCSRKLLKITLKKVAADLAASLSSPRRRSRRLMLQFWLIWWVLGFDLGWGCGWWVRWLRWVGLKLWVVASMGWFGWFGLRLWVAAESWIASEIGFWFGLRFWVELRWLDFGERWVTVTVLCLCLWLVVAGWEVAEEEGCWGLDCVCVCVCFFFSSSCCRSLWLWMVGQRWKWFLLLCCDGLVFFFFFFFPLLLRFLDLEFVAVVDRRWCCCYCWW